MMLGARSVSDWTSPVVTLIRFSTTCRQKPSSLRHAFPGPSCAAQTIGFVCGGRHDKSIVGAFERADYVLCHRVGADRPLRSIGDRRSSGSVDSIAAPESRI